MGFLPAFRPGENWGAGAPGAGGASAVGKAVEVSAPLPRPWLPPDQTGAERGKGVGPQMS